MILDQKALSPVGAGVAGRVSRASPMMLCMETFWKKEVRMLIKAGSTYGLVGAEDRPIGRASDSY